jgi:hypothetical protein
MYKINLMKGRVFMHTVRYTKCRYLNSILDTYVSSNVVEHKYSMGLEDYKERSDG